MSWKSATGAWGGLLLLLPMASACGKGEPEVVVDLPLPGFTEVYPGIDPAWLAAKLEETGAQGVFVLEKDGAFRTQHVGDAMRPRIPADFFEGRKAYEAYRELEVETTEFLAHLPHALILVEPGCTCRELFKVLGICNAMKGTEDATLSLWNMDHPIPQRTRSWASHTRNYPEYGIFLEVEIGLASSGDWHYRWGSPWGKHVGADYREVITEKPYPWTEVETLPELIRQLKDRFKLDKTIHLRPDDTQPVEHVLLIMDTLLQSGFLYVELD